MSWVVPLPNGKFRLITKGAPTYVWDYATSMLSVEDGVTLLPLDKEKCFKTVESYQKSAMRTLALAYRDFDGVVDNVRGDEVDFDEALQLGGRLLYEGDRLVASDTRAVLAKLGSL